MKKQPIPGSLRLWQLVVFLIAPVLCALVCLCIGRMNVPVRDLVSLLLGREVGAQARAVLWSMRLPRVLLAALVGAGLSVSGCVFQSLFANPLATPDTLGVASGASFGAALALLLGFRLIGVQLTAFFFGMVAVSLTCLSGKGSARTTMILSGIMMGSLFSALVSLVKFTADTESQLPAITYWLMGSLSAAGFGALKLGAPAIAVSCGALLLLRWKLNLLPLPGEEARTFGTNIPRLRAVCIVCCAAMTASCVAMCGQVGWVGLLVPHVCRLLFGNSHARLLPACISCGACFLMIVDTLARTISAAEIPVSILTAILGAPIFITIVRSKTAAFPTKRARRCWKTFRWKQNAAMCSPSSVQTARARRRCCAAC